MDGLTEEVLADMQVVHVEVEHGGEVAAEHSVRCAGHGSAGYDRTAAVL